VTSPPSSAHSTSTHITRAVANLQNLTVSFSRLSAQPSLTARQNTHSWSYSERQTLVLLKRVFKNDFRDFAHILNNMFPCATSPFHHGMMASQYSEIRTWLGNAISRSAYASVWKWSLQEVRHEFVYQISRAHTASTSMAIDLVERSIEDPRELRVAKGHRRSHPEMFRVLEMLQDECDRLDTPMSLAGDESDDSQEEEEAISATYPDFTCKIETPILSPPVTARATLEPTSRTLTGHSQQEGNGIGQFQPERLPLLLFRCTGLETAGVSSKEHIYSGRQISVCSDPEALLDDCELHLGRHAVHSSLIRLE
jgi:hypothetical protein